LADAYSSEIKLIDFESSRLAVNPLLHFEFQTLWYRAPEVVLRVPAGFPADIWSLAVTAVELFIATPVFQAPNEYQLLERFARRLGWIAQSLGARSPRRLDRFERGGKLKSRCAANREGSPWSSRTNFGIVFDYEIKQGKTRAKRAAERARR
jgi:serine/threonine protein kinase